MKIEIDIDDAVAERLGLGRYLQGLMKEGYRGRYLKHMTNVLSTEDDGGLVEIKPVAD